MRATPDPVPTIIYVNLLRYTSAALIGGAFGRARAQSLRQKIITIPARIAHRSRQIIMHLPTEWKWRKELTKLYDSLTAPPPTVPGT